MARGSRIFFVFEDLSSVELKLEIHRRSTLRFERAYSPGRYSVTDVPSEYQHAGI